MAVHSRNSSNWSLSLKIMLVSSAVLSVGVALKVSVPVMVDFAVHEVPLLWSVALSWLRPPYLYLLINGIIITIVASSKLQNKAEEPTPSAVEDTAGGVRMDYSVYNGVVPNMVKRSEYEAVEYERVGEAITGLSETKMTVNDASAEMSGGDEIAILRSPETPQKKDPAAPKNDPSEFSLSAEKPLVSARFGHRKSVKSSPEGGKALRVTRPKRQDTLESTWKTITEGRPMPLTRHLKKSDTWETHARHSNTPVASPPQDPKMKKSETFTESSPSSSLTRSPGSGKLRKEPSLSQDELNRRVEAFIKKFNEEMRLQRQESICRRLGDEEVPNPKELDHA